MEYEILDSNSLDKLVTMVNSYIADGWQPQGGIAVYSDNILGSSAETTYCQAMIKKD